MDSLESIIIDILRKYNVVNLSRFQKEYKAMFGIVDQTKQIPMVNFEIGIKESNWDLYYQERVIPKDNNFLRELPEKVDTLDNSSIVFNALQTISLCPGNPDFPDLIKNKLRDLPDDGYHFKDKDGGPKAAIQNDKLDSFSEFNTIRIKDCSLVIDNEKTIRCSACKNYRHQILSKSNRRSRLAEGGPAINTNFRYMSKEQLSKKSQEQALLLKSLKRSLETKDKTIQELLKIESISKGRDDIMTKTEDQEANDRTPSPLATTLERHLMAQPPPPNYMMAPHYIVPQGYLVPPNLPPGYPPAANPFVRLPPPGQMFIQSYSPYTTMESLPHQTGPSQTNSSVNHEQIVDPTTKSNVETSGRKRNSSNDKLEETSSVLSKENKSNRRKSKAPKRTKLENNESDYIGITEE